MAQHPLSDECSVVPGPDPAIRRERVRIAELARYLHHSLVDLHKFARKRGLLHRAWRPPGRTEYYWVTAQTAMRMIAYARGIQGEWALAGKDFHEHQSRAAQYARACKEKKAKRALQAAQTSRVAFLGAGAPDSTPEREGVHGSEDR
jgi:hypothetical protein